MPCARRRRLHCTDGIELSVDASLAQVAKLPADALRTLVVRRRERLSDGMLVVLDADIDPSPARVARLSIALVLHMRDGWVMRVEEYFDGRRLAAVLRRHPPR